MNNDAYARGFAKVAEAHGVDPVGLAKYAAGISGNPTVRRLGEKVMNMLVSKGVLTLPSKKSIFDRIRSFLGKADRIKPRYVDYSGVSNVSPRYQTKLQNQWDFILDKNNLTGRWDPKNLGELRELHTQPIKVGPVAQPAPAAADALQSALLGK